MANSEAVAELSSAPAGRIVPFGKYLLLQRVSVGGMAEVFKALPEGAQRIDQIVAVKRILPSIAEDHEFIGMFVDEARIAGQLTHPNICRIYELGRVGDDHYIAMQFLWGRDLLRVMNRFRKLSQPMPPVMAAFIAARASAALHYAHNKTDAAGEPLHILHRDVSPQNLIVGYSGKVKLIDFGVARAATQVQKTQAGILKGKFGYMSPEMIRRLPVDHRSDVFAMGICLHEALTCARLFVGDTDFATLELVRDAQVPPPSSKAPGVPAELDAIVLKALARDADDRYQSAAELEQALDEFVEIFEPGYGEAEVGAMMRDLFAREVAREKQHLEAFADMLARGRLVRGARLPVLPPDSVMPGGSPNGSKQPSSIPPPNDGPITAEHAIAALEAPDKPTEIFFSAEELDEIRELDEEPTRPRAHDVNVGSAISDVIMRGGLWSPSHVDDAAARNSGASSGLFHRAAARPHDPGASGLPSRESLPTLLVDPRAHSLPAQSSSKGEPLRYIRLALIALALVAAGYAGVHYAQPRTGSIEIAALSDPTALVRVDGIVRGIPPILVEDLEPGIHEIDVKAKGYEIARGTVHVSAGEAAEVNLVLERTTPAQNTPSAPMVEPVTSPAPATSAPTPGQTKAPAPRSEALRDRDALGDRVAEPKEASAEAKPELVKAAEPPAPANQPATPTPAASEVPVSGEAKPEPAAPAQAKLPAPKDPKVKTGELLISTLPWSRVFIDNTDTGSDTPVRGLQVPEGSHRIGLRTPDNVMHYVDVSVKAGETVRVIRRF